MRTRIYAMNTDGKDYTDECYAPYLTRSRKDESLKRQKPRDRQLYLAAEVLLNRALELSDAGMAIPAVYSRNAYGKPYLPLHTGIHINWSHSGTWVICVLSDREVGIDLQMIGQEPKEALVRRILQPEELSFYRQAPVQQKKGLFYQYWTIKESFLKAAGTGFHMPLDTFYICMEGEVPEIVQRSGEVPYVCQLLEFADADYTAALCLKGNRPVRADEARVEYL